MRPVPVPTELDVLANMLVGLDTGVEPLPPAPPDGVAGALERAVLGALERPPCVVSFSGGRDSSAVLAVATDVARRHGLALPIPVTMRFPGSPESDETHWQQLVLDHLGLQAEVLEIGEELDVLGEAATSGLLRLGVRWPVNTHVHAPVLAVARGGSLLTGVGGDELLATQGARHVLLMRGRARPRRSDLRAVALERAPRRVREAAWQRSGPPPYAWLTAAGEQRVLEALAADDVACPHRWDRALVHWYRTRAFAAVSGAIALYAEPYDVRVVQPLVAPETLASLEPVGGAAGFASRTEGMRELFGGLLPAAIIERETKAVFTRTQFGPGVRAFARDWDGSGIDERWVDPQALRAAWTAGDDARTGLLLQQAWLAQRTPSS